MHVFVSKKISFILLFCANFIALGIIFLLNYVLLGPKLSWRYDFLLGFRSEPPVSGEILLIDTEEIVEPGDIYTVIMTLSEMGASELIIEVPVLGRGSGRIVDREGLNSRVNDEFSILGRNIRSLFDAIRLGYVSPADSPALVNSLIELSERGRDRLNAAIRQEEASSAQAAQAATVFGRVTMAEDLRAGDTDDEIPWYSRPRPDSDRILRRIAPSLPSEIDHIVYKALKHRWTESVVEHTKNSQTLVNRFVLQGEETKYRFRLDREGNILIEKPREDNAFNRLNLEHFREYEYLDRVLARLLKEAQVLGVYSETPPEQMPVMLYDFAENFKKDMLNDPSEENYAAWINTRLHYIESLDDFLYGPTEMILVNGYEELIAERRHNEESVARLQRLRDELIRAFVAMREKRNEFINLYELLSRQLNSSFCIMRPGPAADNGTDESSALLANALLTGRSVTPGSSPYIIIFSFLSSLIALVCVYKLRPGLQLLTGLAAGLLCGAVFCLSFILGGYWIDPVIPAAACFGGTLFLTVPQFFLGHGRKLRFRLAYSPAVNKKTLVQLLKAGRPALSETTTAHAAIIAVKNPLLSAGEDRGTHLDAAKAAAAFRETFSGAFRQAGAFVFGFSGDTACACFGSPHERLCWNLGKGETDPSQKAVNFVNTLLKNKPFSQWQFGIESGECAFSWSKETGCTVSGHAALRARLYSSLTKRFNTQAIIGETIKNEIGPESKKEAKKLASLSGENFYAIGE